MTMIGTMEQPFSSGERVDLSISTDEPAKYQSPALITPNKDSDSTSDEIDAICTDMLDTVDSCVGFVNQIALQHDFEDSLVQTDLPPESFFRSKYQFSESEASLIRLQIMEHESDQAQAASNLPNMDLLNLCGSVDDDLNVSPSRDQRSSSLRSTLSHSYDSHQLASRGACGAEGLLLLSPRQCTVCLDAVDGMRFPEMPCCMETSICTACIRLLTHPITAEGQRAGRCPCCRSWITATPVGAKSNTEEKMDIAVVEPLLDKNCSVCNQIKEYMLVQGSSMVCDACFLGRWQPLEYECQGCNTRQRIPHPMYRYQVAPGEFGTMTWACSQGDCGKFTRWRICADQLGMIPIADAPWSDNAMQMARQCVQERTYQQSKVPDEECIIL